MFPFLHNSLSENLEKQKSRLFHSGNSEVSSKSLISSIWEIIITTMIVYFLYSMINSLVNERIDKENENSDFSDLYNQPLESTRSSKSNASKNNKKKKSM